MIFLDDVFLLIFTILGDRRRQAELQILLEQPKCQTHPLWLDKSLRKEESNKITKSQYIILLVKDYKEIIWKDKPHRNGGFIISLKILIGMWHHHQTSIMWRHWFQIKELDQGFSKYKMKYIWEKEKLMKVHFQSLLSFIIRFKN